MGAKGILISLMEVPVLKSPRTYHIVTCCQNIGAKLMIGDVCQSFKTFLLPLIKILP